MPLVVCPTPIGNLEDVTLERCASSARRSSSSARTPGGPVSSSIGTGSGPGSSPSIVTTRPGGSRRWFRGSKGESGSRSRATRAS